ncbi:4Fe-4S ferredoxin iron-sulfur binding domain protein [Tolumonas auensis DSM 9187]|uniref:4Fe-4S ferredoxin iron-sulfur binding domain protein n=1 Tax=Tolumonas auensis (strain DSM 9187 / NBRC 110442 / TA 4) TaxID=595494 RepID=C4LAN0_TOLAT|nr:4Fe-4S ferredoxin iron-sulfur binding domain protein [Tolumonas auensis DSM 9187]
MSCAITEKCVGCFSCIEVCPKRAIREQDRIFTISAKRCNECKGHTVGPRCIQICPVEGAIYYEPGHPE